MAEKRSIVLSVEILALTNCRKDYRGRKMLDTCLGGSIENGGGATVTALDLVDKFRVLQVSEVASNVASLAAQRTDGR